MIITKKKFEAMVQQRIEQEVSRREYERFIDDRFRMVYERIDRLENKISPTCQEIEAIKPCNVRG